MGARTRLRRSKRRQGTTQDWRPWSSVTPRVDRACATCHLAPRSFFLDVLLFTNVFFGSGACVQLEQKVPLNRTIYVLLRDNYRNKYRNHSSREESDGQACSRMVPGGRKSRVQRIQPSSQKKRRPLNTLEVLAATQSCLDSMRGARRSAQGATEVG